MTREQAQEECLFSSSIDRMLLKAGMGNEKRGMENVEWEMQIGNVEWENGMGN